MADLVSVRRLSFLLAAGAALYLFTAVSDVVPALPWFRANVMVSLACALTLIALFVVGLAPLRALGHRLLAVAAVALPLAMLSTYLGWLPASNLAKVVFAVALGLWLAAQIESLRVIAVIAAVAALVDIYSVFLGPTRALLSHAPQTLPYFAVALTWFGYSYREAYSAIGTSDLIFFGLYLGAAFVFRLRRAATVVVMTASFLVTVALALWGFSALPALPLLSAAFLAVNADLLWKGRRAADR